MLPNVQSYYRKVTQRTVRNLEVFVNSHHKILAKIVPTSSQALTKTLLRCPWRVHYSAQASYFAAFRGIRDTKIEKSRGIRDKISL